MGIMSFPFVLQSKDQIENILEDRSKLVASQLQTALEQIQAAAESEALSASELRGLQEERHHEKASFAAEVWKLVQQGLGKESICLMNGVNQPSQFQIKEVRMANRVDKAILEGCRRDDEQITTQGKEHAKSLDLEKLKTLSTMDDLGKWVQRLEEEENRQWVTACNESRHSRQDESVAEGLLADVTGMKETEQQEVQRLELGAESQMVQEQLQADGKIGIPEEAASQEEKDNEEATNSSSQLMELQQQLKTLDQENEKLASRFQAVEQLLKECNNKNDQLSMQLQQREKREEEMSGELGTWKEHAHSLEVETLKYLSVIEKSHERLQRLEEENKRLVTSNDECGQSLKDALQEIMLLANELAKLEQEKDLQMGRTLQQAAALQKAQEQLQAASERDVCLVSELKELDAERAELQFQVREMQMQVQDLSADNVHVAAEVRRLDQKLEAVASEKRGLSSQVDQLVQDRQRRDVEVAEELSTWKEHVRNLESEKLEFLSSAEALNQQIWRLGDEKKKLINESNQSLQELWGENARLKKEIGKLEAEKDRQEGERLELVAGLQTVWEKLQAANERETFLMKELTGLQGCRDAELTGFVAKIQELQQQLQELTEKYDFVVTQSLETSRMLDELQMDKVQLGKKVSELVLERETREEEIAREKVTWKEQLEAEKSKLQSESANLKSVSEDLNEQLQRSGEEIRQLGMRSAELSKMLEELQEEKAQLVGELDKLEEVKEQQEGERLELAAKLQVAWNQLSEVRDSETHLTSELQVLREERETERLKSAAEVQDLECQLHQVQEDKGQFLTRVQELTQTLEMLHDAKVLLGWGVRMGYRRRSLHCLSL
jgi:chromosome segregation ATPase